ncbi:hypothetical protein FOL46_009411, partial [Perkinsus olseni]
GPSRCVIEERHFGAEGKYARHTRLSEEIAVPWQASVGAVFSEIKGKYVIDYVTLGETRTSKRRRSLLSQWATRSQTNTLWWLPEPAGLPFTRYLPETEGLGCEETIIEWGKALLKGKRRSVDNSAAVLAVARETLRESILRDSREARRFDHAFGPIESLLPSSIMIHRDEKTNKTLVNFIKFVDYTLSTGTIELPLLSKNLNLMRAWTLCGPTIRAARSDLALKASQWEINSEEIGISEFFIKGWERVVGLAGKINEGTELELSHQGIKGSGRKIVDAYVNGVKTSYAGLKNCLQTTYELSTQCRRAQWVLRGQQLSELKIGLEDNKKVLDFLEKLPAKITRYVHLQYKDVIDTLNIQKMKEVVSTLM